MRIRVRGPGAEAPTHTLVLERELVVVGRSRAAHVRLPEVEVSGAHAQLTKGSKGVIIEDMESANGTSIGGRELRSGQQVVLQPDDPVHIGGFTLWVDSSGDLGDALAPLAGEAGTSTLAGQLVRELLSADDAGTGQARLRITPPGGSSRTLNLVPGQRIRMGRDPGCELCLEDPELSREHAVLIVDAQGVTLRDLGSKNGVTVDDAPVHTERLLQHGAVVRLGSTRAELEDPAEKLLRELDGDELAPLPTAAQPRPAPVPAGRAPEAVGRLGRSLLIAVGLVTMAAALWALWIVFG